MDITDFVNRIFYFSDFPAKQVKNMDIIDAGLEVLENNMMASSNSIESARFTNNHITHIEADAFR